MWKTQPHRAENPNEAWGLSSPLLSRTVHTQRTCGARIGQKEANPQRAAAQAQDRTCGPHPQPGSAQGRAEPRTFTALQRERLPAGGHAAGVSSALPWLHTR